MFNSTNIEKLTIQNILSLDGVNHSFRSVVKGDKEIHYYNVHNFTIEIPSVNCKIHKDKHNKYSLYVSFENNDNILNVLNTKFQTFNVQNRDTMKYNVQYFKSLKLKFSSDSQILLSDKELLPEKLLNFYLKGLVIFDFKGFCKNFKNVWEPQFKLNILYLEEFPLCKSDYYLINSIYLSQDDKYSIRSKYLFAFSDQSQVDIPVSDPDIHVSNIPISNDIHIPIPFEDID